MNECKTKIEVIKLFATSNKIIANTKKTWNATMKTVLQSAKTPKEMSIFCKKSKKKMQIFEMKKCSRKKGDCGLFHALLVVAVCFCVKCSWYVHINSLLLITKRFISVANLMASCAPFRSNNRSYCFSTDFYICILSVLHHVCLLKWTNSNTYDVRKNHRTWWYCNMCGKYLTRRCFFLKQQQELFQTEGHKKNDICFLLCAEFSFSSFDSH